jgi:hypothetical protein
LQITLQLQISRRLNFEKLRHGPDTTLRKTETCPDHLKSQLDQERSFDKRNEFALFVAARIF